MRFKPLSVAVLCSRQAPGIDPLLRHPSCGRLFNVSALVTSEPCFARAEAIEGVGVPVLLHPLRRFCEDRGSTVRDRMVRAEYDAATAAMLSSLGVDCVLLLGYLYVLTAPMLTAFPERILNLHDSDLSIRRCDGERRYVGLRSTRDAILAGECTTRSTVHIVTAKLDDGPIVMVSDPYPVPPAATNAAAVGDLAAVKSHAWVQRQTMMNDWGSLAASALELVASGWIEGSVGDAADAVAWDNELEAATA